MFFRPERKKAVALIALVFFSYFLSRALFLNVSLLMGAVFLGALLNNDKVLASLAMAPAALLVFIDKEIALSFEVYYPVLFGFTAYVLLSADKKVKKGDLIFFSTMIISALFVCYMGFMEIQYKAVSQILSESKNGIEHFGKMIGAEGNAAETRQFIDMSKKVVDEFYVFLGLLQFIIMGILNFYIISRIFTNLPDPLKERFSEVRIPFWGIWGLNIGLAVYLFSNNVISLYGLNAVLFFAAFYFLQGVSFSSFFFKKFEVPVYVSFIFYVFFIFSGIMWLILSLVGIADVLFNLKKHFKEVKA